MLGQWRGRCDEIFFFYLGGIVIVVCVLKKKFGIVLFCLCVDWLILYYFINFRWYEVDFEDKNNMSFIICFVNLGVIFFENFKEDSKRIGFYEF